MVVGGWGGEGGIFCNVSLTQYSTCFRTVTLIYFLTFIPLSVFSLWKKKVFPQTKSISFLLLDPENAGLLSSLLQGNWERIWWENERSSDSAIDGMARGYFRTFKPLQTKKRGSQGDKATGFRVGGSVSFFSVLCHVPQPPDQCFQPIFTVVEQRECKSGKETNLKWLLRNTSSSITYIYLYKKTAIGEMIQMWWHQTNRGRVGVGGGYSWQKADFQFDISAHHIDKPR